ncbi:tetratricopeptide repeat protein [Streptacidiphilus jiangxiensis]|uniref:Tetratricopeptide repeat-containing protein n=1 Tax=Streptacidiphilus jiangxiensis TaxID=235985 RepID=A0A1H8AKN3_STRJI|nr:tetratricopeptide repeat protein [Streptacidiphilus jiangxiensis]SEM71056.1 Tetratricopeptide repeat-containing protein [Streptacidiphilus jiangxiensis]
MTEQGRPGGGVYDWFRRGIALLAQGNAGAAVQLLSHAVEEEPHSRAIREALARAQFETRAYAAALENFRAVALADPSDDYAQFGWGLAAARLGDFEASAEHLALAVAMRPSSEPYRAALRQTRATLKARAGGFGTVGGDRQRHDEVPAASQPTGAQSVDARAVEGQRVDPPLADPQGEPSDGH